MYVFVPAEKAENYVVVVWRLYCILTLKQELCGTRTYKETSAEENFVVNDYCSHFPLKFSVNFKDRQESFPRGIGYLSFIKK